MTKKNDVFEIRITDISDDGAGIGKTEEGFTWFVKDTVIGDRAEVLAMKVKKSYGFARLVRIIEPSKNRVKEACPIARKCGGCQLQAMSYKAQLDFKERKVINNLRRIGGFDIAEPDEECNQSGKIIPERIIAADEKEIFRYRNKAQYPVGRDKNGNITAGFYAGRTHSIIPCEDCLLGAYENRIILDCITEWMKRYSIEPYDEKTGRGVIRHILIRKGFGTGEIMVCPVINERKMPHEKEFVEGLRALSLPEGSDIASISYSVNTEMTNVIMGDNAVNIYGKPYIEDVIKKYDSSEGYEGIRFRISPLSFFQVNPAQMAKLYNTALEYAGLTGQETVWDLYCGTGTISLFLAQNAGKVYGIEIIPQAIENARENARLNGIENAEFFVGKAEEVLPEWYEKNKEEAGAHPDVIVVDPPRKGCDEKCLDTIVRMSPERVVYVSCDSATLARDLRYLCDRGYEVKRVRACDMFPMTVHVETVVLLSKLKTDKHINVESDMDELDLMAAERKATYE